MKRYLGLSLFAFAVLSFAAVWLGGLNQDEGWGLYAASLVADGKVPYLDFFYTQGPVTAYVYAALSPLWEPFGLVGGRVATWAMGALAIVAACRLAASFCGRKGAAAATAAALATALLLGSNLYHVYYTSIPKTYALASLFFATGFLALSRAVSSGSRIALVASAAFLALAAGTRYSFGAAIAAAAVCLFAADLRRTGFGLHLLRSRGVAFAAVAAAVLAAVYGPFLVVPAEREGLFAAFRYHVARAGGVDLVFSVGSLSRLVRWYLPVFVLLGLGFASAFRDKAGMGEAMRVSLVSCAAVFAVQFFAPFPYEDYQTPLMPVVAAAAAALVSARPDALLLALGLSWASSFGSPLLEKWTTDGQDRFWTIKKEKCEMALLKDAAKAVEALDPGGKTLLTQDLYLAVESRRKVPDGLEMGPFSMLGRDEWLKLLSSAPCPVAAFSGYGFSIKPPECVERPFDEQMEFWNALKKNYSRAGVIESFGQNSTTLIILKRGVKEGGAK